MLPADKTIENESSMMPSEDVKLPRRTAGISVREAGSVAK
jgi:hypothetical protein